MSSGKTEVLSPSAMSASFKGAVRGMKEGILINCSQMQEAQSCASYFFMQENGIMTNSGKFEI